MKSKKEVKEVKPSIILLFTTTKAVGSVLFTHVSVAASVNPPLANSLVCGLQF